MKYTMYAAHPNDIVAGKWKRVDEFDHIEDLPEHLASPSFDWYPGMCVKCMEKNIFRAYTGIYSTLSCVDVGPTSNVMIDYVYAFLWSIQHKNTNYIEFWKTSISSNNMMASIALLLPKHDVLKILCACLRRLSVEDASLRLIEAVERGVAEKKVWDAISDNDFYAGEQRILGNPLAASIAYAVGELRYAAVDTAEAPLSVVASRIMTRVISILSAYGGASIEHDKALADFLRESIPFYDIALRIVK